MSLKELLGEELYQQVVQKAGDQKIAVVSDGNWIPKDKFNEKNDEAKAFKKQLEDRDKQLQDLSQKAAGNETLLKQIEDLQNANKKATDDFQAQLNQQAFDFALKDALSGAKAKNPKAVEALLNRESIKLEDEKLTGLDEQLKALKESDAYLFEPEQESGKPNFSNGQHQRSEGNEPTSLLDALSQKFN
jgi:Phage minor structural protein GP20